MAVEWIHDSKKELAEWVFGKKVLIVGGGPTAGVLSKEGYAKFDVIVRLNNYKKINSCRTDIFFSYFGRNIRKSAEELSGDGVKFLVNKYPNADMTDWYGGRGITTVSDVDYRWVYELRKDWWFTDLIQLSEVDLIGQVEALDGYMPTVGFSAVLFFRSLLKAPLSIVGFDCFESNIHNLNEVWEGQGGHRPAKEKVILENLSKTGGIEWIR